MVTWAFWLDTTPRTYGIFATRIGYGCRTDPVTVGRRIPHPHWIDMALNRRLLTGGYLGDVYWDDDGEPVPDDIAAVPDNAVRAEPNRLSGAGAPDRERLHRVRLCSTTCLALAHSPPVWFEPIPPASLFAGGVSRTPDRPHHPTTHFPHHIAGLDVTPVVTPYRCRLVAHRYYRTCRLHTVAH